VSEEALYRSVGGVPAGPSGTHAVFDPEESWDFGWVPPARRTEEQNAEVARIGATLPRFAISGRTNEDEKKVCLFELWKHPDVVAALGYAYDGTHQLTGSCVGAGGGNVAFSLASVEVLRLGDPEKIILPFYPYTYGRSRFRSGMGGGQGEGSTGAGWAEAATKDGILDNLTHTELPKPNNSDGLVWGRSVEMDWSAGGRSPCTDWLDKGVKHLIKTAAQLRSADEVEQAIRNLYPVTCASMYGHRPQVKDGVLMGIKGPRWSHQMSIHAVWLHPTLGRIFYLMNQWGKGAHGIDPAGGPAGGVWITDDDVDWICNDEVFAFSQFDGYPAPDFVLPWVFA
jgi:hypothetical protein